MNLDRLDHLVLTVRDLDTTCEFYKRVLGLEVIIFREKRRALQIGDQKINLHEVGQEFKPMAATPTPGSGDLCFTTREPLQDVIAHLQSNGVIIEDGPVRRTGARHTLLSVYLRDPDGNLVEISNEIIE